MATIIPQSELVKKAIQWISEGLCEKKALSALIEEAAMRFNLSPRDVEFLDKFFREKI